MAGVPLWRGVNRGIQIRWSAKINGWIRRSAQKINQIRVRKLFSALDDTRDTKRLQLLELPCVILCFSAEDDYQRNIYVTNVCIETKSRRYEKKEQTCGQCHTTQYWSIAHFSEFNLSVDRFSTLDRVSDKLKHQYLHIRNLLLILVCRPNCVVVPSRKVDRLSSSGMWEPPPSTSSSSSVLESYSATSTSLICLLSVR